MLSIVIPVYEYDIRSFVRELHQQATQLEVPWEIRLIDDGSSAYWQQLNEELKCLPGTYFSKLPTNTGRARIRNRLANAAQYDYLLFMDCDSGLANDQFLSKYVAALKPETVLCGGRIYKASATDPAKQLHWWYGSQREVKSARLRNRKPYQGFMTNNFVVPKAVLQRIPFEEQLTQYGHEDTLFGLELERAGVAIRHLDNPLIHVGLDPSEEWLIKQRQAIRNLYWLHLQHPDLNTKALQLWKWTHRTGLLRLLYKQLERMSGYWQNTLLQKEYPGLWRLDLLKVYWLEQAHREAINPVVVEKE